MKQKQPAHCKGCKLWHKAGHKKGTALHGSKYDNWCCHFSTHAPKAVSICKLQRFRGAYQRLKLLFNYEII